MKIFTHLFKHGVYSTAARLSQEMAAFRHFKWRLIPFSSRDDSGIGEDFIYCPHPFTNWSLNPGYKNPGRVRIHTVEGFRKTADYESVEEYTRMNAKSCVIYCLGGSTTYCTEVTGLHTPWPSLLHEKIKRHDPQTDCVVVNAGVGGWNTLQSLIRLESWGPFLKPGLIVVFQSKNDLTPLYNAGPSEKRIFPDYSNLMGQFSQAISKRGIFGSRICKQSNGGVGCVYGEILTNPEEGLLRFSEELLTATTFRYYTICAIAERLGARVLFVPEIIWGSPYYRLMQRIHKKMHEVATQFTCASFFDIQGLIPNDPKYFLDKMHFTEAGCDLFSDLLARHITSNKLIVQLNRKIMK